VGGELAACLANVILFGERSLRRALSEYVDHFHAERNHQGKGNVLLFPEIRTVIVRGRCGAASDWADCYATIIKRGRRRDARRPFQYFDPTGSSSGSLQAALLLVSTGDPPLAIW
jgi:hypothetical protein